MDKYNELLKYSNPEEVFNKAIQLGYNIKISTRNNKKYMIESPLGYWVHFGQMGFEDASKHKDLDRINNYKKRNWRQANKNKFCSDFLNYTLLWS